MDSCIRRRWCLLLLILVFSACNRTNANDPPGGQLKPGQTKILVTQVIDDEVYTVSGDAQLALDLTPPDEPSDPTFPVHVSDDGSKEIRMAANDQGQICWVTYSFTTIVQLNGSVDAQTLALNFSLTEVFEGEPTTTSDCSVTPPIDGALLFIPVAEGPYRLTVENPVFKLSSAPNAYTEVRLETVGE